MKKRVLNMVTAIVVVIILTLSTVAQAGAGETKKVRVLVSFGPTPAEAVAVEIADEDGDKDSDDDDLIVKFGGLKEEDLPIINGAVVTLPESQLRSLAAEPRVKYVELDREVFLLGQSSGKGKNGGGPVQQPPQTLPTGIDRVDAEKSVSTGLGVKVAVVDTGVDYNHPDLAANYKGGYDFVNNDADAMDDNGHGTHVAGTIAAADNAIGVVGVAPGASLYAVKVLSSRGSGWMSDIIAGINWAAANQMDVVNMSLGAQGSSDALHQAIINATAAGVTVVVAAGNDSADASQYIPASYGEVITVSAIADLDGQPGGTGGSRTYGKGAFKIVQADDALAYYSNYGAVVDIAAPGMDIYSTYVGGGYKNLSGTSMATPHVAGAAVLYIGSQRALGLNPGPVEVQAGLQSAGWHPGDYGYFTGDKDSYPEPVLKADIL